MLRVGLTGGLASGKSFVARRLGELGCHIIRADDLGHEVLAPGGEAYRPVIDHFGGAILKEDGTIDRRKLASLVFDQPEKLAKLNSFVHPAVFRRQEDLIAGYAAADPQGIVVVEAAIMYETGTDKRYRKMIVAACPEEMQVERAMSRDGMTREQALARLRRQIPIDEKRKRADYVIDTSGTKENTVEQTDAVYRSLRSLVQ